jgi:CheY-like chemotaxis protein
LKFDFYGCSNAEAGWMQDEYSSSKKIRAFEATSRVPIIAITAGTMKEEMQKCFDAMMDDFISKPIVNNALSKTLRKWLVVLD